MILPVDAIVPDPPEGCTIDVETVEVPGGEFLRLREITPGDPNWAELYDGRFGHIYFGHQPFIGRTEPVRFPHATALDLGLVYGGALCAVVLEGSREVDVVVVEAEREYTTWFQ